MLDPYGHDGLELEGAQDVKLKGNTMKTKTLKLIAAFHFSLFLFPSPAAVPLRWTVETSRLQPAVFDVVRGETLALEALFQSYGTPVATSNMTAFLCWQTNGMGSAWWTTNAVTSATVASVLFTPDMDPGAPVVNAFLGLSDSTNQLTTTSYKLPSLSYRAAFTLRFRNGPGAIPNVIDHPVPILDLAHTVVINPPWPTQGDFAATTTVMKAELKTYVDEQISGAGLVTPTEVTNISSRVTSNVVTKAYVESLGISAGLTTNAAVSIAANQVTNDVAPWALSGNAKPSTDLTPSTNYTDACCSTLAVGSTNISYKAITNEVTSGYLCTVAAAAAMTNGFRGNLDLATYKSSLSPWTTKYGSTEIVLQITQSYSGANVWSASGLQILQYHNNPTVWELIDTGSLQPYFTVSAPSDTHVLNIGGWTFNRKSVYGIQKDGGRLMKLSDKLAWSAVTNTPTTLAGYGLSGDAYTKTDADSTFVPKTRKINGQPLTNDITIAGGVTSVNSKTGDVTIVASDVGAYPNASGQTLASQVATQGAHLNAEDAQFVATNYDSQVNLPEATVRIKLQQGGTNVWRTIWEEMRRWNAFCGVGFNWQTWGGFHTWSTNILAMIEETSPKEYAFYDGVTGEVSPDGFFWISQPRIAICARASYQRYLDAGGAVWILESNGLVANVGGTTNGYFRISDEEGNTHFEIITGDKQTVPATARTMRSETVMGVTHWFCDYAVTNAIAPPVAKFCRNLGANPPVWYDDTNANCPCNVTWTPGANTYTLEFWPKSTEPAMFCKAEYDRGGETRIRQSVPTEMQYIILNGTKYGLVPKTVNGELVMGLTTGN